MKNEIITLDVLQEARAILDFCVRRNARSLLEGACVHLLQGWLSVVNVLALHVPLPFIDTSKFFFQIHAFQQRNYAHLPTK